MVLSAEPKYLVGCPSAARWLRETYGAPTHFKTIENAAAAKSLPASKKPGKGHPYVFQPSELVMWWKGENDIQ